MTLNPCYELPSTADEPLVETPPEEAAEPAAAPVVEEEEEEGKLGEERKGNSDRFSFLLLLLDIVDFFYTWIKEFRYQQ